MCSSETREPQVSVIIPAYRVTAYIAAAIDSVLAQTFRSFELLVVNDDCPDTAALESVLRPYLNRIVYLKHATNSGPSAARNTGIRAARGEFIAFLDGDDLYLPEYLAVQMEWFANRPEADMIYGSALIFGDDPSAGMPIEAFRPSDGPINTVSLLQGKVTVFLMSVIRRRALLHAGLFDESIRKCEDFDLWLRMAKQGAHILHHDRPIARYRVRRDSASADSIEMCQYLMKVADKFERESKPTVEEATALAAARLRWTAESDLERGKLFFRQGRYAEAAERFREANRYYRRSKLAAMTAALTFAPRLVAAAMDFRQTLSGLRTPGARTPARDAR